MENIDLVTAEQVGQQRTSRQNGKDEQKQRQNFVFRLVTKATASTVTRRPRQVLLFQNIYLVRAALTPPPGVSRQRQRVETQQNAQVEITQKEEQLHKSEAQSQQSKSPEEPCGAQRLLVQTVLCTGGRGVAGSSGLFLTKKCLSEA